MTDRLTASTINDEQLDELLDLVRHLTSAVADAYELTPAEVLDQARQVIAEQRAARRTT